ncbi:MAG: ABC transporter ATP-binding protein [Spirochaetales bacterium]|jgi:putative ABC transport system ATP-binding protein|nr:ABC transporter ATP-binding protein [Spirochaetales bacterium]
MLLEIGGLTKAYTRNHRPFAAVKEANLSLEAGEFAVITGRSGSGKTTLLSLAAGLLKPSSGAVVFQGQNIFTLKDGEISFLRNTKIGYLPQGTSLLPSLTVLDNVRLPFYLQSGGAPGKGPRRDGETVEKALSLLDRAGILPLAPAYPQELSGGEQRRVSIARALFNAPALLLADEPTGDLDEQTTAEIMGLLRQIAKGGAAILLVTHEPGAVCPGDRRYVMNAGTLTEEK